MGSKIGRFQDKEKCKLKVCCQHYSGIRKFRIFLLLKPLRNFQHVKKKKIHVLLQGKKTFTRLHNSKCVLERPISSHGGGREETRVEREEQKD